MEILKIFVKILGSIPTVLAIVKVSLTFDFYNDKVDLITMYVTGAVTLTAIWL